MSDEADEATPLFGHACPQHPEQGIRRVTRDPAPGGGFLVTAEYACGHRHTQYARGAPTRARDTRGASYEIARV